MKKYKDILTELFREQMMAPPALPNARTHDVPRGSMDSMLDQETDSDDFLVQGVRKTFSEVQKHFDSKMTEFGQNLSPENVKNLTISDIREALGEVSDFTNRIQVFSKAKIDTMKQDPYAIMAGFIASEPTKQSAFEALSKTVDEFSTALEEIETKLSTVHSKIEEFVKETEKIGRSSNPPQGAADSIQSPDRGMFA